MTRPNLDTEGLDAEKWAQLRAMPIQLRINQAHTNLAKIGFALDLTFCGGMDVSEYLDESRGEA